MNCIICEAGPVKGGSTVIAFIEDRDGYKIELIENKHASHGLGKSLLSREQWRLSFFT